jgi:hypothetical protein
MRRFLDRLIGYWSDSPWLDYLSSLSVVGTHLLVIIYFNHGDILSWSSLDQRIAIYGSGAAIVSIIGGLSAIAITVYVAADGVRARAVRAYYHMELRANWRALFVGVGLSAGACLVAQVLDSDKDPLSSRVLFEMAMTFAVCRFLRLVWLFDALVGVSDQDLTDQSRVKAPELGRVWRKKFRLR